MKFFILLFAVSLLLVNCGEKVEVQKEEVPVLMISAKNLNIASAENSLATLDVAANVAWSATSNRNWLKISSTSGSGNATITISAAANTTLEVRTGEITVSGNGISAQTVTITQACASVSFTLTVSATALNVAAADGSSVALDITSNTSWTAASNQSWLTCGAGSGNGNQKLQLTATANPSTIARVAVVTVSGKDAAVCTVVITQAAAGASLTISATALNVAAAEGSSATLDITTNTSWTASSDQAWLTCNAVSGNGNQKLQLTATANSLLTTRNAVVTISGQGLAPQTVTVTQAARALEVHAKPDWVTTAVDYQYTMTYIAQISISGNLQTITTGDEVAAFAGNECRGAATVVATGNAKYFYLLIKGNQTGLENLTFKYYQKSTSHIFDLNLTKDFVANQAFGTLDLPFVFDVK